MYIKIYIHNYFLDKKEYEYMLCYIILYYGSQK